MIVRLPRTGQLHEINRPAVMGIINATPDSFHEQSRATNVAIVLEKAGTMLAEGAAILDIGGMSTRPGANESPVEEEMSRLIPAIAAIRKNFPEAIISADTYRAAVASEALNAGADMINDIGASLWDEAMPEVLIKHKAPVIIMHTQGKPATMQQNPQYANVVTEVFDFLIKRKMELNRAGVHDVWIDPGFGFGKTLQHNYQLLAGMEILKLAEAPALVGLSRKSMATRLLGIDAAQALNATTALHMAALHRGADILRVHDVREAMECVRIYNEIKKEA